ncbi:hypothetical protein OSB04_012847 [Centaurea solstitialis]|uniref:Uncharacterized protein n=1 Tax=Centaurea solstitialis TaxID=347529 RepID=A0AA38TWV8_9ASTR|nr:hypothetical protein OSB04_012847 [Centaurea solstitialis]
MIQTYIKYKTRQKRADAKKALNDLFFRSGYSKFTLENTNEIFYLRRPVNSKAYCKEREWSEPGLRNRIRYRGMQQNRPTLGPRFAKETSLLFYNFPRDWGVTHLWRLFKRYGTVSDIYMAFKRLRNGEKFGFVRFRGVQDEVLLERRLKKIWIGDKNMKVHLADKRKRGVGNCSESRNPRPCVERIPFRRAPEAFRSYADAVKGIPAEAHSAKGQSDAWESMERTDLKGPNLGCWQADKEELNFLQHCVVGSVTKMEHVDSIQALISTGTLDNCEIKMLGGNEILLKFESKEAVDSVIRNKVHGIHFWVKDLKLWSEGFRASNRLVWLRIMGIPLQIWKVEVFKDIARNWGSMVTSSNCDLSSSPNLMWGKVLINTSLKSTINEIKSVKVGGLFYVIKVEEEDGVGLEGQIRNYHQQVMEINEEEKDFSSNHSEHSEWSEDVDCSEEEGSVKNSCDDCQEGVEKVELRERCGKNMSSEDQRSLMSRIDSKIQNSPEVDLRIGKSSPEKTTFADERKEDKESAGLGGVMMKSVSRPANSKALPTDNKGDFSSSIPNGNCGLNGILDGGCGLSGGPHLIKNKSGPNELDCNFKSGKANNNLEGEPNCVLSEQSKDHRQLHDSILFDNLNQADSVQKSNLESIPKRREGVASSKSKSNSSGIQRSKGLPSDKLGFGRGRASIHGFKKMARAKTKKPQKIKQAKRKSSVAGDRYSSEIQVSLSSELKGDGLTENVEEFGEAIGVIWNNAADFDFVEASGNSGGLLLIWNKNTFQGQFVVKDRYFIAVVGKWENKEGLVGFVNVYGPNDQKEREALCKLDRFLVTSSYGDRWRNLNAKTLERKGSDHSPILMCDHVVDFGPIPFKFFDTWLKEDAVEALVKKAWHDSTSSTRPDCIFRDKLKKVKLAIKEWRKSGWGEIDKKVRLAKEEVKSWEDKGDVSLLDVSDREKWVEARKKWLELEEKNTAMARQRAKIKWVKEGDENSKIFHMACKVRERRNRIQGLSIHGNWSENPKEIKRFVFDFFKQKFANQIKYGAKLKGDRFKKISMEEAIMLERKFSEEEVWNALKDCGCNKSPGPDGFTTGFLNKFWSIVKGDLMEALHWFWEKEALSEGCNSSFITLIPKNTNPICLNDFRPISLVGVLYKVISKVLAERMKMVMGSIISDVQSAFLKGRSILDGVLVANETVSYLKRLKRKALIFKVDFEKAYDSVNWDFLLDVLEYMGFGIKWRKWIRSCLNTSKISILVNGSPTDECPMERGIRQGDPLAPFLFLVVAEGLNVMVEEALEKGLFKGVKVGSNEVVLSHLQYADDVIFFGEWGAENIVNLVKLLKCFHAVSGLKVNIDKCSIFGVGVPEVEVVDWAKVIGCSSGLLPFTYLGLPVGVSMKRISHWEKVITKVKNKLSGWKTKWISFGGRLTLVKSVLSSIPLYFFSLFHAPVLGGSVGGGGVLKEKFSRLFQLENSKEALVAERGYFIGKEWFWSWNWRRDPRGREVSEFEELCRYLEAFKPRLQGEDKVVWKLAPLEGFSVKLLRSVLGRRRLGARVEGGRREPTSWVKAIPAKVNVFYWRAALERLPCRVLLDKRGVDLDTVLCPRCNREVESVTHSLFSCEKVKLLWILVGRWWNLDVSNAVNVQDCLLLASRSGACAKGVARWEATVRCVAYLVWANRNKGEVLKKKQGIERWDVIPIDRTGDRKKRDPLKSSAHRTSKAHRKRNKSKPKKDNHFEEFDDDPGMHFQATFGNRWYSWSFKSWEESFSQSRTNGFEWREDSYGTNNNRNKWRTASDDEESDDDNSYAVGSHSDRITLGLPTNGPLNIDEVKIAFRLSALKWHPDKHQGPSQVSFLCLTISICYKLKNSYQN